MRKQYVDKASNMQDSSLSLCRSPAEFLQIGVLLVDEAGICRFANDVRASCSTRADEARRGRGGPRCEGRSIPARRERRPYGRHST
jgi:hypothetical protein